MEITNSSNQMISILTLCIKDSLNIYEKEELSLYIDNLTTQKEQNIFISLARQHGILPLIYRNIKQLSQNNILLSKLKINYQQIAHKNILMSAELIQIISILKKNNIKSIVFKGPSLAILAYGDITMRQFVDLDILVKPHQWEQASKILANYGYIDILDLQCKQKEKWNQKAKEINLYNSKNSIYIDLQRYIFDDDYPLKFNYNLFNNMTYVEINKQLIPTFNTEALLIYLTIHGSKHLFEKIGWIKDIDMIIRTQRINWILVDKQLETLKDFKRMFLLGIYLSYIYYQTPIPKSYIKIFHTNKWLSNLETFIRSNWQYKKNFIYHTYASLNLFPSMSQKASYISKVVLKPSKNEYRLIQFPNGMHFLYYPLRVFSLIKKYLFSF